MKLTHPNLFEANLNSYRDEFLRSGRKLIKVRDGLHPTLTPWLCVVDGRVIGLHARSRADAMRQHHYLRNRDDYKYADMIDIARRQQRAHAFTKSSEARA